MSLKKGIIKCDISDHFPIFVAISVSNCKVNSNKIKVLKQNFNDENKESFKNDLSNVNWPQIDRQDNPNLNYSNFFKIFSELYNKNFPINENSIKVKDLNSPWITKGLKKSSKLKQKLYIKFLKNKNSKNEQIYKSYKNLFKKIRKKSKNIYYSSLIAHHQNNSKKIWNIMKEITGKVKSNYNDFPKALKTNEGLITDTDDIAKKFNEYFTNIGPNLATKIPNVQNSFRKYLPKVNTKMIYGELSIEEFEIAFKTLKRNKAKGVDNINGNIVIDMYNEIKEPLFNICKSSISKGIFPDALKTAKVKPVFKSGDVSEVGNYRPISILPFFSKILEKNNV